MLAPPALPLISVLSLRTSFVIFFLFQVFECNFKMQLPVTLISMISPEFTMYFSWS